MDINDIAIAIAVLVLTIIAIYTMFHTEHLEERIENLELEQELRERKRR